METLAFIISYGFVLPGVCIIEYLLTINLLYEITITRGNSNKESVTHIVTSLSIRWSAYAEGLVWLSKSLIVRINLQKSRTWSLIEKCISS